MEPSGMWNSPLANSSPSRTRKRAISAARVPIGCHAAPSQIATFESGVAPEAVKLPPMTRWPSPSCPRTQRAAPLRRGHTGAVHAGACGLPAAAIPEGDVGSGNATQGAELTADHEARAVHTERVHISVRGPGHRRPGRAVPLHEAVGVQVGA